jgi:hypothetical protein
VGLAASLAALGQQDVQFPIRHLCPGQAEIEGPRHTDRARKAAELTLDQVKGSWALWPQWRLLTDHDKHVLTERHAQGVRRHAGNVDKNFNRLVRFEDVNRWVAFPGAATLRLGKGRGQLIEQILDVLPDHPGVSRG